MSVKESYIQLLNDYMKLRDIPNTIKSQETSIAFHSGEIEINMGYLESSNDIIIVSYIDKITSNDNNTIFEQLLKANFAIQGSSIGSLGLCNENNITLNVKLPFINLDCPTLDLIMQRLLVSSRQWKEKIQNILFEKNDVLPNNHSAMPHDMIKV